MRLTVPTLVAFHPMVTEITAVVSVDGFYVVCYSLLIYLTLRLLRDRLNWRLAVAIGAVFAVGFLTKPTINGFAPLIALAVAYDWQRGRGRRWDVVRNAALMGAVILLPAGWWMARSLRINNDLFYFNPVLEGHRVIQNPFYAYDPLVHMWHYYQSVWGGIFVSWWGLFGWLDTPLPPWVYHLLRGLTMAAIIGLFALWQRRRENAPSRRQWQAGRRMAPAAVWLFLGLTVLAPIILLQFYDLTFWWEYGNGRGLQGRYWLGTVVPMLTFFALGLLTLLPGRWRPWGHHLLRGGMVLLNLFSLLGYILPRYYL
jgi:4-amino-4-deoxy-L-arabinose transferase-like glycosyltransferase